MLPQLVPKRIKKGSTFFKVSFSMYTDSSTEVTIDEWRVTSIMNKRMFDLDNRKFVTAPRVYLAHVIPGVTANKKTGAIIPSKLGKYQRRQIDILPRHGNAPRLPVGFYSSVNKAFEFAIKTAERELKDNIKDHAEAVKSGDAENIAFEEEALLESKAEVKALKRRFPLYKKKVAKDAEKAARHKEFIKNNRSMFDKIKQTT